jgi:hypothetical protein
MKKKKLQRSVYPLEIILVSIVGVTIVSRIITYLILVQGVLPISLFARIGSFRLHHFVYGNILILITSFLAIGLGIRKHKNLFAVFYGIGLGLVLDEFLLWMGDTRQLSSNVLFIPYSIMAVSIASLLIATIIMYRLYKK